jgi:hypothetical protein
MFQDIVVVVITTEISRAVVLADNKDISPSFVSCGFPVLAPSDLSRQSSNAAQDAQ